MNKGKNIIKFSSIFWFVGLKSGGYKVEVLPYIYNEDFSKIKVLTDGKIHYTIMYTREFADKILQENYNLKMWDINDYNDLLELPTRFASIDKEMSEREVLQIKNKLQRMYQKVVNKYFKNELKNGLEIEEIYSNFS